MWARAATDSGCWHSHLRLKFHFKRLKVIMGEPLSPRLKAKVVTALGEKHADKQDVVFAALQRDPRAWSRWRTGPWGCSGKRRSSTLRASLNR